MRYPGAQLESNAEKTAIVMSEGGAAWTYAELDRYAVRTARALRALGVGVWDHVAFCVENRLEALGLHWGAHYAGTYYTPISTRLTPEEIGYILGDCSARVVFVTDRTAEAVLAALAPGAGPMVLTLDGPRTGAEQLAPLLAEQSPEPLADAVDGSGLLYSSGTTGYPKGIESDLPGTPLGTNNVLADLLAAFFGFGPDSVYISPAPYYHAAPFRYCFAVTAMGGTVVMMPRFDAEEALAAIERHRVSHSQWVPTMLLRMLRLDPAVRERYDLSSHRVAVHAAAPMPAPAKHALIEWWGPILHEYYASSEGAGMCHCTSEEWLAHPGTVGRAVLGELQIRSPEGELLATGEDGLVCFAGGRPFAYHEDAEKTAEAYLLPGVATVGDIGHVDEDGYLFLTDRKSNMIITGGVNVYPQEAENVLAVHPKVADVAVIGVPNDDFGEEVRGVVTVREGEIASPELAAELIAHAREHLADVKCPRRIDFRDELPREPNGKLIKRRLRDEYWAERAQRIG